MTDEERFDAIIAEYAAKRRGGILPYKPRPCVECRHLMAGQRWFRIFGVREHHGRGLCAKCYHAQRWAARVAGEVWHEDPGFDWVVVERLVAGVTMVASSEERFAAWQQLRRRGLSQAQIAARLGVSSRTVFRYARRAQQQVAA